MCARVCLCIYLSIVFVKRLDVPIRRGTMARRILHYAGERGGPLFAGSWMFLVVHFLMMA